MSAQPFLVLASASTRRRELLESAGWRVQVRPANADESRLRDEPPAAYVLRLARAKAAKIATGISDAVVLGADTTVVLDGDLLGKPGDAAEARTMLARLSGRTHEVLTGVSLRHGDRQARQLGDAPSASGRSGPGIEARTPSDQRERPWQKVASHRSAVAITRVTFAVLTAPEIAAYVATGEPFGKAGAYAIQGRAACFIPRIEGSWSNVVGLPLALVWQLWNELTIS